MPGSENSISRQKATKVGNADRISTTWYANVAPAIPLPATGPQSYTYRVPPDQDAAQLLYTNVTISLGKRQVEGTVIRISQQRVVYPTKELKPLAAWQLTANQVVLATWIHETMRGGLGYTLRLFFPPGKALPALTAASVVGRTSRRVRAHAIIDSDDASRYNRVVALTQKTLRAGRQTLIIVPEKWLITRLADFLQPHFPGQIISLDAEASSKHATAVWQRVQADSAVIVIGTQKSLFLPWCALGLIIVEEEFYTTHKLWDQYPRLDNRLVAQQLAHIHRAQLVYATSFPSLKLFHDVATKQLKVVGNHPLSPATTVIMPTYEDRQSRRVLPLQLVQLMQTWLAAKKRIAILHNVLGAWRVVVCRSCHTAVRCPECGMAVAVHGTATKKQLQCHHCGTTLPMPTACPKCTKKTLTTFGAGTQRISEVIAALFPSVTLQTIAAASDPLPPTPRSRGQIVVGTTALFTRLPHHWADQTVWLFPERSLLYPDFRSEERSLATLMRLAQLGPSDRVVTLVTHKKPLVTSRLALAPNTIQRKLLLERQRLGYPPTQDMVLLTWQSKTSALARQKAATVRARLEELDQAITIRGPFASFQQLRRGKYEQHLLLLGPLDRLRAAYATQPTDRVDVLPERVL